jgi:uncharacterized protein (UPF0332 family)
MKAQTADYLAKAHATLAGAQQIATLPLPHIAAREAYLAVFHAAEAYIFEHTGKVAKTHCGVRSEFARLAKAKAMSDTNMDMPFFDKMATKLLASELILNSLILKDLDWAPEHEVRQFILEENANLAPCVSIRSRGTETVPSVPYIKRHMPLHQPGSIAEIVIGPTAPSDAEDFASSLLAAFHSDPRSVIRRSTNIL